MKQIAYTLLLICLAISSFAQHTVKGIVVDSLQNPLRLASIEVEGQKIGTETDENGNFELQLPNDSTKLIVSYVGYKDIVVEVGVQEVIKVILSEYVSMDEFPVIYANINYTDSRFYKEIPSSISLSRKILDLDNDVNIAATLNRVPGVFMHTGALNTNRITIRGIGNRNLFGTAKIRAFLNEIPLTNGSGETTLEDIDLSLVENIDLIKGPTSSAYGAGLGGVIRLNTKDELDGTQLQLTNTVGSYNLQRNILQYQHGEDNFNLSVGLNRTHSDGYRDNNEYDRLGLTVLGNFEKDQHRLTILLNHIDLKAFIPSSLNANDFENEPRKAAFTWGQVNGFEDYTRTLTGVSYQTKFASKLTNITSLFSTHFRSYESRPFNILRESSVALGGRTKFRLELPASNYLEVGAEYFNENYDWQINATDEGTLQELLSDNTERRQYLNLFFQSRWYPTQNFFFTAGLNYNTTNYDLEDRFTPDLMDFSGDYSFEAIVSPFLSLYYYPSFAEENISFYAVASHGFSAPTLEETLTPEGIINPDIQPEQGWNFELGSRGTVLTKLQYNISLYTMQIRDLLVARRTDFDQFIGINAGRTVHTGLELSINSSHTYEGFEFQPFLNYSYSDYSFQEFEDGEQDFSGNDLTGTAPHILSAGIQFEGKGKFEWYGNINYQFVDQMPLRDDNSIYSEAYDLLNIKLGYLFQVANRWTADLSAGINNLWDEKYASMLLINAGSFGGTAPRYYYPGLPLNYYASLRINYRL